MLGFGLLVGATVLLQIGSNISVLIVGRLLQGLAAGVVWTVGLALLVDAVGPEGIGMAMGVIGMSMSISILLAPILGGIVFDKGSYDDVFAMCYILCGIDVVLRLLIIERKEADRYAAAPPALHPPPAFSAARWPTPPTPESANNEKITLEAALRLDLTVVTALPPPPPATLDTSEPIVYSPTEPLSPTSISSGHSTLFAEKACFKVVPRKLPTILILLCSPRLLSALWGVMVQAALLTSFDSTLPLFVRETFGWDSIGAGLMFMPLLLPSLLSPIIGKLADRYGARWFATVGFLLATPFLVLLRFVADGALVSKVLMCTLFVLLGLSFDLMIGPLMAEISWAVEDEEERSPGLFGEKGAYAQAYGLFNTAWAAGCLVGPLWGGMVKETAGWGTMTWTLALLSGVTAVPTAMWCGGSITKRRNWRGRRGGGTQHSA